MATFSARDLLRQRRKRERLGIIGTDRMPDERDRPRTRADCEAMPRPCPWVGCRHHLYLDVRHHGSLKMPWGSDVMDALERMPVSCSLDAAAGGAASLDAVGNVLNMTPERVRQVEEEALKKLHLAAADAELAAGYITDDTVYSAAPTCGLAATLTALGVEPDPWLKQHLLRLTAHDATLCSTLTIASESASPSTTCKK